MFTSIETIPREELGLRHARCRAMLAGIAPEASGLLVFSRPAIYHLTGTLGNGALWLPLHGEAMLFVRKGLERVQLESPLEQVHAFRSYGDLARIAAEAGAPFGPVVAAEMGGIPWSLAETLKVRLADVTFVPGDRALTLARAVKSPWELNKLRLGGARHHHCLYHLIPGRIVPGMTERQIAHIAWNAFFEHGHSGHMRMSSPGEEIFLGHVCCGENGNYPSHFNGPLGVKGEHPAVPYMGYAGSVWLKKSPLALDIGFCLEGYHTDKTQLYWSGPAASIPDAVRRAHDTCIEVQTRIAEKLRPGSIPSELYRESLSIVEKAGISEGFMGLGANKVPFLGHGIGLAVDEYPVIAARFDEPLETGMVMALEPKIGIAGVGMVGVENTFEVTSDGGRSLTGDAFDMVCIE